MNLMLNTIIGETIGETNEVINTIVGVMIYGLVVVMTSRLFGLILNCVNEYNHRWNRWDSTRCMTLLKRLESLV